jgi:Tfp pilus assembly protein PilE
MPSCKQLLAVLATCASQASCSYVGSLSTNAQGVLNESMSWMDEYYDRTAGYLYSLDAAAALRHDTRSSAWYAIGLLARNEGDDVSNAEQILTNIIHGQYKDPTEQWYVLVKSPLASQIN